MWPSLVQQAIAQHLAVYGQPVTYYPYKGKGEPVTISAIPLRAEDSQPSADRGYYSAIDVLPTAVAVFERKDQVEMADGSIYEVTRIEQKVPGGLKRLALHLIPIE